MSKGDDSAGESAPAPKPVRFEHVSNWVALAANLGVVAGLVLVLVQLQQNERMIRAQTRHELATGITSLLLQSAADEHLNQALYRGNRGLQMSPEDANAYFAYRNALLRYWEDVHYQYRMGLYDEEEFDRKRLAWKVSMNSSAFAIPYWCRSRGLYSAEFAREMDSLLPAGACTKPAN